MTKATTSEVVPGSFRDPSGFVFRQDGILYRQVNFRYRDEYDHLLSSGLHGRLVADGLLISHEEVSVPAPRPDNAYRVIRPAEASFISYPYEWCFSQLKDAALALLQIQKVSLEYGMSLKDASAYNMQFLNGRPVLIDTLSFERYRENQPWVAYRQFCQHFLAPLALMTYRDIRLNRLLSVFIDGVPLDMASAMLPSRTRLSFSLLSHIHLHARSQRHYADRTEGVGNRKMGRFALVGIIESLESATRKLRWSSGGTEWADYYDQTSYAPEAFESKKRLVREMLERISPENVWDLGANTGEFSRLASHQGIPTVAFDIDPAAVERNYLQAVHNHETHILPLVFDFTNPSPAIGWENSERMSLAERGPCDTALALALVHHLAISNNVPLARIAAFLRRICRNLIMEFVPKEDSQVQRLLATREDVFPDYTQETFEQDFGAYFTILERAPVANSGRVLYSMKVAN